MLRRSTRQISGPLQLSTFWLAATRSVLFCTFSMALGLWQLLATCLEVREGYELRNSSHGEEEVDASLRSSPSTPAGWARDSRRKSSGPTSLLTHSRSCPYWVSLS